MNAHELAKKLLDGPDLPVVVEDGLDPSDRVEVTEVKELTLSYLDGHKGETPCIYLE